MGNSLWLSLYIKTDGTDLEFIAGPQKCPPRIRGVDQIVYSAEFIWPRKKGAYQVVTALSRTADLPPLAFMQGGEHRFRKGEVVTVDQPVEFLAISAAI